MNIYMSIFFTRNTSKLSSYFWQTEPSISDFPATVTWPIVFFVVPIEAFSESGLRAELPADEQYDVGRSLGFLNPQFFFMNYKYYAFFFDRLKKLYIVLTHVIGGGHLGFLTLLLSEES